ncbi:hypothetical protein GCM10022422_44580 [Flavobacterium ginsengisoli]|uniref:Thioredoxin domain-containing protein n=1 Tax=Flavobacterium ginsengisoli TaxID=871694 RepID=A0ABP7G543_9FLAO|nr:redoxin domain-containing protein [Flavobacterium ginsengisoli]
MKKAFRKILILLIISASVCLGFQIILKINHKKEIEKNTKMIPNFSFLDLNGKLFENKNLKKTAPIIFIYFNTDCEYCNEETKMIQENIERFKNIQIIFISFENINQIKKFAKHYKLNHYDNVHFLHDTKATFASTFDVNSLPCILLYDQNQELIEKIKGQTKPEILIKKLKIE